MLPTLVSARRRAARTLVLATLPLAGLGVLGPAAGAAPISLVKAINTSTGDSTPSKVVALGGKGYFLASNSGSSHDSAQDDLYVTDGTEAGTDVFFRLPHPAIDEQPENLVVAGSAAYFAHTSVVGGDPQLWSTNATSVGTQPLSGLTVSGGTDTHGYSVIAAAGTDLYFTGSAATTPASPFPASQTLYRLSPTSDAHPVAQVIARVDGGTIGNVTVAGSTVFFTEDVVTETSESHQLWATDGTTAHTTRVPATSPRALVAVGSRAYWEDDSTDPARGPTDLWTSDGQTTQRVDFHGDPDAPKGFGSLVAAASALYLTGQPDPDATGPDQRPVWRIQGSTASKVTSGAALPTPQLVGAAGNTLLFTAGSPQNLYAFDGTTSTAIKSLGDRDAVTNLGTDGTSLFVSIGSSLWRTTGTTPVLLSDAYREIDNTPAGPSFTKIGANTFFDTSTPAEGAELWATGGSATTTRRVKDINVQQQDASIQRTVSMGGKAYFTATDGTDGDQLWSSDGAGAAKVSALRTDDGTTSRVTRVVATPRAVAISASTGLWWSDGTTTRLVLPASSDTGLAPIDPIAFGNQVAFNGPGEHTTYALWLTDGTVAGTHRVIDLGGAPDDGTFEPIYDVAGSQLYFLGWDAAHGYEPWHSDGTAAGTSIVRDIVPGTGSTVFSTTGAVGDRLVFGATDADGIQRMYRTRTDGSGASLLTSAAFAVPPSFVVGVGSDVFFAVNNQVWRVDPQSDLCPFVPASRSITSMTAFGNGVAYLDMSGALTVSGGTPNTTSVIAQFQTGAPISPIRSTPSGLWFPETTAGSGTELWHSDGTTAGTSLVGDLAAGTASSSPTSLGVAGTSLVFAADEHTRGQQLYGTPLGAPVSGPTGTLPACKAPAATPFPAADPTPVPTPEPAAAAAPATTPAPIAKVTPASMTAKVASATDKRSPYLYVFSGLIALPKGADPKVACIGNVLVQIKRGKNLVTSKAVALTVSGASCAYTVSVKLPKKAVRKPASGALSATLSFAGSARLGAVKSPKAITLHYGR